MDDGSSDNTRRVAEEYVKEALDNYKEYGSLGHFIEEMSHIKVQMIIFM